VSGFVLRDAVPADVGTVHRLVRGLAEYERLLDRFHATEADFARVLFGSRPLGHAVIAEAGGRAVGVAIWYFVLSTFNARAILFLEDIFVEPEHRRGGIGLAFIRHLARIAVEADCWSMDWRVLEWNEPALAFYRRIGARPVTDWIGQRLQGDALRALAAPTR